MGTIIKKINLISFVMLIACSGMLLSSGCARYAQTVNTLYQPSATVRGGTGEVYIVIPENRRTNSSDIKWVIGKVKDDDNNIINDVFSPRSPSEIIQEALVLEFKKAGYTVVPATKSPAGNQQVLDLIKAEIAIEQISDVVDLKVKCRVLVGIDVSNKGQLIKRLQYESTSSRTDIKDRDMLARKVLEEAIQSVMLKAVPELNSLFKQ